MLPLAIVLVVAGFLVGRVTMGGDSTPSDTAVDRAIQAGLPTEAPVQGDPAEPVAAVAEAVTPAVVQIETSFGLGSGTVFDADGLVLTNAHVVGSESQVKVTLADGTNVTGQVVGADPIIDIAVVRIDPAAVLDVAVLALDTELRVGQLAVAIGSPFGLDQTVTSGIVSALDRPFYNSDVSAFVGMVQTDAAINAGNSGGALADREGRIIGVPTAIFTQSGDSAGIGLAIPIDLAYRQAMKIVNGEPLEFPFLGVGRSQDGNDPIDGPGFYVASVEPGTAAEEAGVEVGDVIVAIDGQAVKDFEDLAVIVGTHTPGDELALTIERGGHEIELTVTLHAR